MVQMNGISTVLPPNRTDVNEITEHLAPLLGGHSPRLEGLLASARIGQRYSVLPLRSLRRLRTLEERNRLYAEHAVALGVEAAVAALDRAQVDAAEIDALIAVSSTGYLAPPLDARLANRLGLPPACRRFSLTQLGCAGGLGALGLAADLLAAGQIGRVLTVSVELPSLWLQTAEPSIADVLAGTQFGDAAAAAVLTAGGNGDGPEIVAHRSAFFPGTLEASEVRFTETGFRAMQTSRFEAVLRRHLAGAVEAFLASHRLSRHEIDLWLIHPRSAQLLAAIGETLDLPETALAPSWALWERCGNVISSSIFFMLRDLQEHSPPAAGARGLMLAPGVGVSCEMTLLRW